MEMLYAVAGFRVPMVMVNVSRGLAAPITLEADHCDVLAARDSGFLQLHAASCQEVFDFGLMAFCLSEDPRVRLPVLVNQDGFYLSFTREPLELASAEQAAEFVGEFDPGSLRFSAGKPISQAVAVLGGGPYSYFRYQTHLAAMNALEVFDQVARRFEQAFGRRYQAIESYRLDDAEIAFVMIGSFATKAKAAIDQLRGAGLRVGLARPRLMRPLPEQALRDALSDKRAVIVVDQNLSMGKGGVLHTELASALYGSKSPPLLLSFVGGLGGRDIQPSEFAAMADAAKSAIASGQAPPPRLLYTQAELREMRKLQAIAHLEQAEQAHTAHARQEPAS